MSDKKTFTQETLEKIQSGTLYGESRKKRKYSRILLVVDAILVVLLLLYFFNKDKNGDYHSSSFQYRDMNFRFSIGEKVDDENYLFSLTIKSKSDKQKKLILEDDAIGHLIISHNDTIVLEQPFGPTMGSLDLPPGESRTFVEAVPEKPLSEFARSHPELRIPKKRTLLQFEKVHIPLVAKIVINNDEKLSTEITFKYEVNQ